LPFWAGAFLPLRATQSYSRIFSFSLQHQPINVSTDGTSQTNQTELAPILWTFIHGVDSRQLEENVEYGQHYSVLVD
jgi:hypothetical protein